MASTKYSYSKTPVNTDDLEFEILVAGLSGFQYIDWNSVTGDLNIYFDPALSGGDETTLNAVVAAHVGDIFVDIIDHQIIATRDPIATDDHADAYGPGFTWINTATQKRYVCIDNALNEAIWELQTSASVYEDGYSVEDSTRIFDFDTGLVATSDGYGHVTIKSVTADNLGDSRIAFAFGTTGTTKDRFLNVDAKEASGHESTYVAAQSGRVTGITISTRSNPTYSTIIQVIKNAVKGGSGVYNGGTQIGTNLETNNTTLDEVFGNLTGFEFCKEDRITVYLKQGASGQGTADDPVVVLYIEYDVTNQCTGGVGAG